MPRFTFQTSNRNEPGKSSTDGRIGLFLFGIPFAAFGLFAIWGGIKQRHESGAHNGVFIALFGLVFAAIGLGIMFVALAAGRWQKSAEAKWNKQTDDGKKPWLARPEWATGKIKSTTAAQFKIYLLMGVMFCLIGGVSTAVALPQELPKHNYAVLLVLLFPLVGIAFVAAAIRARLAQRRFGDCWFELSQVPAPLGSSLDGLIQTQRPMRLEQSLHLKLSCIRRTVSGSGDDRSTTESILWQDEKVFRPDAPLFSAADGGSGIPVHFNLPGSQPEASLRGSETILWRLEAHSKMAGPDFTATFEVPVFKVAGVTPNTAAEPDPSAVMQMSAEEIRRDAHSKIRVATLPGGVREFYFPAARNLAPAIVFTLFGLGAGAGCVALVAKHITYLGAAIVGFFAVIFGGCGINLLFKSSRVMVEASGVTLQNRWLFLRHTRRFDAEKILCFDLKVGMTSGSTAFHDLKLVLRQDGEDFATRKARYLETGERPPITFSITNPGGITLGNAIPSRVETGWLVCEMTRALGRKP